MVDWAHSSGALPPAEWRSVRDQLELLGELSAPLIQTESALPTEETVELIEREVQAQLRGVRLRRDQGLSVDELAGRSSVDKIEAIRAGVTEVDSRVDELWRTWADGAANGEAPFKWDALLTELAEAQQRERRRRALRDRFSVALVSLGLLALLLTLVWVFLSGSPAAYVCACAAAAASAFIAHYRLRNRVRSDLTWMVTLFPLLTLAVALLISMFRDEITPSEETAVAASVVLVLSALVLSAILLDPPKQWGRPIVRKQVDIPADIQEPEYAQRLGEYLEELRVAVLRESVSRSDSSRVWKRWFIFLGVSAALLSGGAGVTGLSGQIAEAAGIAALLGAGLTAAVTLLNPAGQAQQASTIGAACGSLAEEINMLITIDLPRLLSLPGASRLEHVREQVETISTRFDELREVPQRPRLWQPQKPE